MAPKLQAARASSGGAYENADSRVSSTIILANGSGWVDPGICILTNSLVIASQGVCKDPRKGPVFQPPAPAKIWRKY